MKQQSAELPSFSAETTAWFVGIIENNNRTFFSEHKEQYQRAVKGPFEALLTDLAKEFGGIPYIFRPNRDVRFSRDKTLYKANISGYLSKRNGTHTDVYTQISLDSLFAATGYHEMAPDQLLRYRSALTGPLASSLGKELTDILATIKKSGYNVSEPELKTLPRGIEKGAENTDLLRHKTLTFSGKLSFEKAWDPQAARTFVAELWNAGKLLGAWLDAHVGPSTEGLS